MIEPRRDSKWWGWGDPETLPELDPTAVATLRERIGELTPTPKAAGLEDFSLPPAEPLPQALIDAVGPDAVFTSLEDRLRHATGCGYADLARLRLGGLDAAPDAVLLPETPEQIRRLLEVCAAEGIAVVPYGGGTSVVGGVAPERGEHGRLISLDLARLRGVEVDRRSLTATLGAGLRGPEAETALNREGVLLGHFPQSFEYATVGGFAATRSAGQASSGYGRFDSLVSSVRLIAPAAELSTLATPHTAAGPVAARADRRLGGHLRGDPRRHGPGPPAARRAPLRGLDRRGLRGRGGDRPRPRAGPRAPGRDPPLRRGGDLGLADHAGPARRDRRPLQGLPRPAPPRRRLPDDRRPRGRARSRSPAAAPSPCGRCARAGPPTSANRRAAPGSTAATRAPTCATG